MLGANRSGKTHGGKHEALAHAYGYRFWEVPDLRLVNGDLPHRDSIDPKYWVRRCDGVPIRFPNEGMCCTGLNRERGIGQVLFPAIEEALPLAVKKHPAYRIVRGPHGHGSAIFLPNGSKIYFASKEQDPITFEGFIIDWCWCDEPVPKPIYNGLWARLMDYCGNLWFTLTPLGADCAWMYNELYVARPDDVGIFEVMQSDNPFLSDEMRRMFEEGGQYDEATRAARLYGRFQLLGNRAIPEFDPQVHVIEPFLTKPEWVHILSVDPHHRRPCFMTWFAYDEHSDTDFIVNEWPQQDFFKMQSGALTPFEYARLIRELEGRRPSTVKICDPRFGKAEFMVKGQKLTSFVEDMAETGQDMFFDANIPNVARIETGLQKIRDKLKWDKRYPISPTNRPRLFVFNTCKNTIKGLMNLGYLDNKQDVKGLSEDLSEEFKDPVDTVRYRLLYPLPVSRGMFDAIQPYSEQDFKDYQEMV